MVYTYSRILFSIKKERHSDTYTTWINLKVSILSERSQSHNDKCFIIPLTEICRVVKFREIESRMVVVSGWGKGRMGSPV